MEIPNDGHRLLLTLALTALVFALLSLIKLTQKNRKNSTITYQNLPPGSCGIPVIGESISFVRALTRNKPVKWFRDRIDRHGPVFKTSLMGTKTVVITGREGNRFVFGDAALTLNQPESVAKIFGKHGMFEMTGHKHRLVRADVAGFLKPESIQRYLGQIESVVRDKLNKELDGKDSTCIVPLMKNVTFNVISNIFFGLPDGEARDEILSEFTTTVKGLWSLPLDFPGTVFHKALKARQRLCEKLLKIVEIRKRQIEEGASNNDVVTTLLLLRDENGEPLSQVEVLDTLFGLIIASHDTVTIVLSHFVRLLATHSDVYQKVFQEHIQVADAKTKRSNGNDEGKLSWSDIQTMKYSWRVAQELMRLDPPLLGNFRRVIKDTKFDSYDIPKGWQVFWVSSGTHLDDKIFEDPHRFDPSRFESSSKTYPPYTYIPFGAGPRICPGAEFARVEILLVIHYMVTMYRWTLMIPDEPITRQPAPLPAIGLPVFIHRINGI